MQNLFGLATNTQLSKIGTVIESENSCFNCVGSCYVQFFCDYVWFRKNQVLNEFKNCKRDSDKVLSFAMLKKTFENSLQEFKSTIHVSKESKLP
ncbi:hypothetical protein FGO68_gene3680 [Halteria grandinella]|uniref:Uncharacterized protein n=1 Tax=Halteria grandinella TaxID=5974 RepID=A0A8J8NVA7_HALGN|nr:hypothetical protein FGO68_gene3680 [Halteria grandinella]